MADHHSRRRFLKASGALVLGAAGATPRLTQAQLDAASGEEYWALLRSQFAFSESAVPMNAANLCPSFRAVAETVSALTYDIDRDCSFNNRDKFADLLEQSRKLVAEQLKVSPDEVALVRNTSEANSIINNGLQLERGDEVVLWDQNHQTNNIAWDVRAARYGLTVKRVSTPEEATSPQQLLDPFTAAFSARTRVLALTHVSNTSGVRLPIAELVAAAHARGIFVHVDGAQVWGAMDLDLKQLGVDSFTASAHKWLLGPKEAGLLYVHERNIERIWPNIVGANWGSQVSTGLVGARKFESLGQRDDAALAAVGVAAAQHALIGPQRIQQRIVQLSQRLKEGIADAGLQLVTPMDPQLSFGVCITRAPGRLGREVSDRLYTEHGIAASSTGGVRLCPAVYNTLEHVDRAVAGVRTLMARA